MKIRAALSAIGLGVACMIGNVGTAYAKDPCQTLVCMAGKVQGSVKGGCDNAISDFFDIIKWHNGHLDKSATSDARRSFLNQCAGASQNTGNVDSIISMFGAVRL